MRSEYYSPYRGIAAFSYFGEPRSAYRWTSCSRSSRGGSEARAQRPRPARVLGARSLGGSGRERGAARSRTYVLTALLLFVWCESVAYQASSSEEVQE